MYLHITFGGVCPIQQRLISCPLHWKATLNNSNNFVKQVQNFKKWQIKDVDTRCNTLKTVGLLSSFVHRYFLAGHLWPSRSLSLYMFLSLRLKHYGLQGLGELSNGENQSGNELKRSKLNNNWLKGFDRGRQEIANLQIAVCAWLLILSGTANFGHIAPGNNE